MADSMTTPTLDEIRARREEVAAQVEQMIELSGKYPDFNWDSGSWAKMDRAALLAMLDARPACSGMLDNVPEDEARAEIERLNGENASLEISQHPNVVPAPNLSNAEVTCPHCEGQFNTAEYFKYERDNLRDEVERLKKLLNDIRRLYEESKPHLTALQAERDEARAEIERLKNDRAP